MVIKRKDFLIYSCFVFLMLQISIVNYTQGIVHSIVSYIDEAIYVVFIYVILKNNRKIKKLLVVEKNILFLLLIVILIGGISSLIADYQTPFYSFIDIITCTKFFVYYYAVRLVAKGNSQRIILLFSKFITPLIYISFFLLLIQIFVYRLFPTAGYKYIMESQQLWLGHPTSLAAFFVICLSVQIARISIIKNREKTIVGSIVLSMLIVCSSMRTKAIGFVIALVIIYLCYFKFKKYAKKIGVISGTVMAVYFSWDQLIFYFGEVAQSRDDFIRAKLFRDSFYLAKLHFPLGTGFGSFGSNIAAEHYSPLYTSLGYSGLAGGSQTANWALSDSFWPIVIGQFGFIGLILFVLILYYLFVLVKGTNTINKTLFLSAISLYLYLAICSIAESAFFHPLAVPMAILIGLYINMANSTERGI